MAKKNKNPESETGEKKSSKFTVFMIILLILLIWVSIFALLVKLDVGGIGTMLRPMLKDVPILEKILPARSDEEIAMENKYPYYSMEEAIARIEQLEKELEDAKDDNDDNDDEITDLKAENARLRIFEENQNAFEKRVEEFDTKVVFNKNAPDIEEYKKFYEQINPATAEILYKSVVELQEYNADIVEKAKILTSMKPTKAAEALQNMTADIDYVCKILLSMKADQSAAILDKMDQLYTAKIFKKMSDMDAEKYQNILNDLPTAE